MKKSTSKKKPVKKEDLVKSYFEKEALLQEHSNAVVSAYDFYASIFSVPFQSERNYFLDLKAAFADHVSSDSADDDFEDPIYFDGSANCMIVYTDDNGVLKTWVGTAETVDWDKFASNPNCFVSPVTYYGRTAKARNAHLIHAIAIDVDYVSSENLLHFILMAAHDIIPMPTYIVNSGTGIHAYYVFIDPIPAYPSAVSALKDFKYALTHLIWNSFTSRVSEKRLRNGTVQDYRQYQSIVQGYRIVGSSTKLGIGIKTHAYLFGKTWDPFDLNRFLETTQYKNGHNPAELTEEKLRYKSDTTLEEAKTLYPEWYQRRIVEKAAKNSWKFNTAIYDKWLTYIREQAKVGHRYYCIGSIAVMAIKCGIDKKQVYEDSMALLSYLDSIGYDSDADAFNHFTEKDLNDAINTFYKPENAYYSRKSIEYLTAVHAPSTKRNRRKQSVHLEFARSQKALKAKFNEPSKTGGNVLGGRPSKEMIVQKWRLSHPEGRKCDCIKDTGLSRMTVYKYWI